MSTSSTNFDVNELPGIGETTRVIDLPSDGVTDVKVEARYLPLKTSQHLGTHASAGEVLIFCVIGKIDARIHEHHHALQPNQLVHVPAGCPFRLEAKVDSVVLITSLTTKSEPVANSDLAKSLPVDRDDQVQEALEETFPASDPPSYNSTIT